MKMGRYERVDNSLSGRGEQELAYLADSVQQVEGHFADGGDVGFEGQSIIKRDGQVPGIG